MSSTASGAPRQYTKRDQRPRDAAVKAAKGGRTKLSLEEQYELQLKDLRERLERANGTIGRQQVEFDAMFKRSETMRNRQVDIINRLQGGDELGEVVSEVLAENAALQLKIKELTDQILDGYGITITESTEDDK